MKIKMKVTMNYSHLKDALLHYVTSNSSQSNSRIAPIKVEIDGADFETTYESVTFYFEEETWVKD